MLEVSDLCDDVARFLVLIGREVRVAEVGEPGTLREFIARTMPGFTWSWHNEALCAAVQRWVDTPGARLVVMMPPRHGKSEVVSRRLPAYLLGKHPGAQVIGASYSTSLAARMARDVRRVMAQPEYGECFPDVRLGASGYADQAEFFELPQGGSYFAAGVGKGITGMGFLYGIIDDPLKDWQQANSYRIRDAVEQWYASTFYTRQAPGARILVTMTRWHERDLAGWLLETAAQNESAERWEVLQLPALSEGPMADDPRGAGEALWPARFPVEALHKIRASMPENIWLSLYQQKPPSMYGLGAVYYAWHEANLGDAYFEPNLPLCWALDFNVDPMSSVVGQYADSGEMWCLDEISLPNSNVREACRVFRERTAEYLAKCRQINRQARLRVVVYGDAAGNQRNQISGASAWQEVDTFFAAHPADYDYERRVERRNPAVVERVAAVNARLCGADGVRRMRLDPRCKQTREDLRRQLWKKDNNGRTVSELDESDPRRGHCAAALGYWCYKEFPVRMTGGVISGGMVG